MPRVKFFVGIPEKKAGAVNGNGSCRFKEACVSGAIQILTLARRFLILKKLFPPGTLFFFGSEDKNLLASEGDSNGIKPKNNDSQAFVDVY